MNATVRHVGMFFGTLALFGVAYWVAAKFDRKPLLGLQGAELETRIREYMAKPDDFSQLLTDGNIHPSDLYELSRSLCGNDSWLSLLDRTASDGRPDARVAALDLLYQSAAELNKKCVGYEKATAMRRNVCVRLRTDGTPQVHRAAWSCLGRGDLDPSQIAAGLSDPDSEVAEKAAEMALELAREASNSKLDAGATDGPIRSPGWSPGVLRRDLLPAMVRVVEEAIRRRAPEAAYNGAILATAIEILKPDEPDANRLLQFFGSIAPTLVTSKNQCDASIYFDGYRSLPVTPVTVTLARRVLVDINGKRWLGSASRSERFERNRGGSNNPVLLGMSDSAAYWFSGKETFADDIGGGRMHFPADHWLSVSYEFDVHQVLGPDWVVTLNCTKDGRNSATIAPRKK